MKIGIIDSGMDVNHKRLTVCDVEGNSILLCGNEFSLCENFDDQLGHGTATAGIIHKHNPQAELFIVKIFDKEGFTNERFLHYAIQLCIDRRVNLINISLGVQTNTPHESLIDICEKAYSAGIAIVAAAHNDIHSESYPACFSSVLGIVCGKAKTDSYGYIPSSGFFIAKGDLQRVLWKNNQFNITGGTSFACAHFTGIISNVIENHKFNDIAALKSFMIEHADKDLLPMYQVSDIKKIPYIQRSDFDKIGKEFFTPQKNDWLKKIALFPVSEKEMNTFSEFPGLCKYEIVKSLDYPRNIKRNTENTQSLTDDDWDRFDTMVLGYFLDHQFEANVKLGIEIVKKAIAYDKNIFFFSQRLKKSLQQFIFKSYGGKIYLPEVNKETLWKMLQFKHLPESDTPIISVIGTSNKQGKFTTQLRIKDILQNEGYRVSHISTEPHGELFGATFAFPYGHQGTVNLPRTDWLEFLRILVKGTQYFNNPHIIITGTQGSFIPRTYKHVGDTTTSLDFVFGIQPDGFVCAINPQDTLEQIQDVLDTIRIFTKAKLLFCVLTPHERSFIGNDDNIHAVNRTLSKDEYIEKRLLLKQQLNTEILDIWDSDNNTTIVKTIENAF